MQLLLLTQNQGFYESQFHASPSCSSREQGEAGGEWASCSSSAPFTCYFQALGISPWVALTGHDHSDSCTVLSPGWHGAGQPPVEHCLHHLVQVTPEQGQNHLQEHTAAHQTRSVSSLALEKHQCSCKSRIKHAHILYFHTSDMQWIIWEIILKILILAENFCA